LGRSKHHGMGWHRNIDVILLQEVSCSPGCMRMRIILLERLVLMTCEMQHNMRSQNLIDVTGSFTPLPLPGLPVLTPRHQQERLQWALQRQNWCNQQWHNVIFSDKSCYCISTADGRTRLWRRRGERYDDNSNVDGPLTCFGERL
jgi:hypothetical protein